MVTQNKIPTLARLDDYALENLFSVYQTDDEIFFYNLLNTVTFPIDLDPSLYFFYTVNAGDIWPSLSQKIYGTIKLWWLICVVNQIQNPLIMPPAGTKLKVLTTAAVNTVLKNLVLNSL